MYNNHIFIDHKDERLGGDATINWDEGPGYNATGDSEFVQSLFYKGKTLLQNKVHTGPYCRSTNVSSLVNCATQSLPDFDNPCERVWNRYFADNATIVTWFNRNKTEYHHKVSYDIFIKDCHDTVIKWRTGVRQIRQAIMQILVICKRHMMCCKASTCVALTP